LNEGPAEELYDLERDPYEGEQPGGRTPTTTHSHPIGSVRVPIAVFDIDGTLTDTMNVDVECYEAAILEVIGVVVPDHWPALDEVTDPAILEAACQLQGRAMPDASTERRTADRVAELLSIALERTPERFSPIAGARTVFEALGAAGWRVAMATGAWRQSALVKLAGARIPSDGVPLATSSDHRARSDIIRHAVEAVGGGASDAVVYIGDGVWDGRAATSRGYGFVGVGSEADSQQLRRVGAVGVVPDLSDVPLLLKHLDFASHEWRNQTTTGSDEGR